MSNPLDTIPTAEEAAAQRSAIHGARAAAEAVRVAAALKQAIEQGQNSVMIQPSFDGYALISNLRQKGYSVNTRQTGPNESGTEISW